MFLAQDGTSVLCICPFALLPRWKLECEQSIEEISTEEEIATQVSSNRVSFGMGRLSSLAS